MKKLSVCALMFMIPTAVYASESGQGGSQYTMMQVMHDLAYQLNRIQFGILTNNRHMIKEGAKSIARHPKPKGGLKPYLRKNAGAVKDAIPEMDRQVHLTAKKMAEAAGSESIARLQRMANTIAEGCVGCHDMFRD